MTRIEELRALAETTANAARLHPLYHRADLCGSISPDGDTHTGIVDIIMADVGVRDTAKQEDKS